MTPQSYEDESGRKAVSVDVKGQMIRGRKEYDNRR
jgi:hypothetical protein